MRDSSPSNVDADLLDTTEWTCLELVGSDREEWLQGQATNDVRLLKPGTSLSFCLCEPTGGLLAVLDAWALDDRTLLTTARDVGDAVLDRVERMTIMEDVSASVSPFTLVSLQGPGANRQLGEMMDLPSADAGIATFEGASVYALRSRRTAAGGWDMWLPAALAGRFSDRFRRMDSEEYEAARIEAGIPKWGVDMGPKSLPPELGRDFESRHVSYQKGCYTGQEVLMRIHSRGHTNRTWIGLVSEAPLKVGTSVEWEGKPVGTVSSAAASNAFGQVAAATIRNEATTDGTIVNVSGVEATVRPMPIIRP